MWLVHLPAFTIKNVGKYTIYGSYGIVPSCFFMLVRVLLNIFGILDHPEKFKEDLNCHTPKLIVEKAKTTALVWSAKQNIKHANLSWSNILEHHKSHCPTGDIYLWCVILVTYAVGFVSSQIPRKFYKNRDPAAMKIWNILKYEMKNGYPPGN